MDIRSLILLAMTFLAAAACAPEKPTQDSAPVPETIDVAPSPSPSTLGDVQAAPPRKALTGILPGDFPRELPIYLPASIIDFGKEEGRRFVVLQSPDAPAAVEAWLRRALKQAGFELSGGRAGHFQVSRGGQSFGLRISGQGTTEFRYEY